MEALDRRIVIVNILGHAPTRRRRRLRHAVRPGGRRAGARRRRAGQRRSPTTRTRVLDGRCPTAPRCRPTGRCRCPRDYVEVLRTAVPAALARSRRRPGRRRRHRHRLHRVHDGADRSPTAPRCASCRSSPAEPHAYVKLWKHHAAQAPGRPDQRARRASAASRGCPATAGSISSEWEFAKGLQLLEEDARGLRGDGALGRGGRLDRLAADRHLRPQRVHRRLQGHPPGRRGTRPPEFLRRAATRRSRGSSPTSWSSPLGRLGDRAGRADRARRRRGPGCRRASRWRSATSTRTSPRPPRRPSSPARWSRSWARPPAT